MNVEAYKDAVLTALKKRYGEMKGADVTEVVQDTFGGDLVVIRSEAMVPHEEIAFVYPNHQVRIFGTTEELVHFLETQSKKTWFDKLFTKPILSGLIFIVLLVIISLAGLYGEYDGTALTILGNVVSLAAGFFFGTHKQASP